LSFGHRGLEGLSGCVAVKIPIPRLSLGNHLHGHSADNGASAPGGLSSHDPGLGEGVEQPSRDIIHIA
jgi:hypothetical protein